MKTHRSIALLFASAVLLAGCGGGGSTEGASDIAAGAPPTTSAMPTTTNTTVVAPPQQSPPAPASTAAVLAPSAPAAVAPPPEVVGVTPAQAEAAVLQRRDLPDDWKAQDASDGLHVDVFWREVTGCLGLQGVEPPAAWAVSAGYMHGLATQARTMVEYRRSSANAEIAGALEGPAFKDCALRAIAADVDRSAPQGAVREGIDFAPLNMARAGERTISWRAITTVNVDGLRVPLHQDFVVAFKGQAVVPMAFLSPGSPFPPDLEGSLVQTLVSRS